MHASPRFSRRAGRWLGALAVLAVAAAGTTRAAPQNRGEPANQAAQLANKRVSFDFRNRRWQEVLEWFAKETGLPLISTANPTGTLNFIPTKESYTVPEAIDIINEALQQQKFLLIRREASFTVVPADDPVDPALLPRVSPDELRSRGKTE